jgi:hypothetical protein
MDRGTVGLDMKATLRASAAPYQLYLVRLPRSYAEHKLDDSLRSSFDEADPRQEHISSLPCISVYARLPNSNDLRVFIGR